MKRVVVTGGSYNPPHDGHIQFNETVYDAVQPDEVWMWVSHNPFKPSSDYAPLPDRMEMCEIAAQDHSWLKVKEMESSFHDTKTASSLVTLKEMFPETEFIWAFGDDNFASFHTWDDERFKLNGKIVPDWQFLMHEFSVAVLHRKGYRDQSMDSIAAKYGQGLKITNPALLSAPRHGWSVVESDIPPYSSTRIKEQILERHYTISGLHPHNQDIIYVSGLYGLTPQFNTQALAYETNNDVRFQTFITLASGMNLAKSCSWNAEDVSQRFASAYDLATAQKYSEPANALFKKLKETQQSIDTIRYGSTAKGIQALIDNLASICALEGLEKHRAMNMMDLIFEADDMQALQKPLLRLQDILNEYLDEIIGAGPDDTNHYPKGPEVS